MFDNLSGNGKSFNRSINFVTNSNTTAKWDSGACDSSLNQTKSPLFKLSEIQEVKASELSKFKTKMNESDPEDQEDKYLGRY